MRQIINARLIRSKYTVKEYLVEYEGDWLKSDLITAVDNGVWINPKKKDLKIHHYGGYVEQVGAKAFDGTITALVGVYTKPDWEKDTEVLAGYNCPNCGYVVVNEYGLDVCYQCGWHKEETK